MDYVDNNMHKKQRSIIFNNTNNTYKRINNYSNDIINNSKINQINNLKKTL